MQDNISQCERGEECSVEYDFQAARHRVHHLHEGRSAWLRQFCAGDSFNPAFRRRIIDVFINTVYLYDDKLIIYYYE